MSKREKRKLKRLWGHSVDFDFNRFMTSVFKRIQFSEEKTSRLMFVCNRRPKNGLLLRKSWVDVFSKLSLRNRHFIRIFSGEKVLCYSVQRLCTSEDLYFTILPIFDVRDSIGKRVYTFHSKSSFWKETTYTVWGWGWKWTLTEDVKTREDELHWIYFSRK